MVKEIRKYIRVPITLPDGREFIKDCIYYGIPPGPNKDELRIALEKYPYNWTMCWIDNQVLRPSELTEEQERRIYPNLFEIKE